MGAQIYFRSSDPHVTHEAINQPIGSRFLSHSHDYYELLLFKSGCASYIVEGRRYPLQKNTLIITRPFDIHRIYIEKLDIYERYSIIYDAATKIPRIEQAIPKNIDIIHLRDGHPILDLFSKMDYYHEHLEEADFKRLLCFLSEEIFYNVIISAKSMDSESVASTNPLLQRAVKYIEEHLIDLSSIDELCEALFITKSHLHHIFSNQMQITPKKYILSKRLSLAKEILNTGKKPTSVYSQCGFNNYSTFYREYKRYFGYPPSDNTDPTHRHEFND